MTEDKLSVILSSGVFEQFILPECISSNTVTFVSCGATMLDTWMFIGGTSSYLPHERPHMTCWVGRYDLSGIAETTATSSRFVNWCLLYVWQGHGSDEVSFVVRMGQEGLVVRMGQEGFVVRMRQEGLVVRMGQEGLVVRMGQEGFVVRMGQEGFVVRMGQEGLAFGRQGEVPTVRRSSHRLRSNRSEDSIRTNSH